jgi:hypothetical protein
MLRLMSGKSATVTAHFGGDGDGSISPAAGWGVQPTEFRDTV